ncbi:MAG TPA: GAF domain-containing SpoIIE family protein phosphatase [Gemmatimonadaceae bacterium]|nr:GAF domain-containing SpoIIE family protein phosphatase [Gemmatimonadaceae bacterium]
MSDLTAVLTAFRDATQCEAAVWTQSAPDQPPAPEARTATSRLPEVLPAPGDPARTYHTLSGPLVVTAVPGPRRAWLVLGPCPDPNLEIGSYLKFLLPVVSQYLQSALEVEHAANELAERYEEINLLYTISEILGRTVSLEEAARTILTEISETVGARRASILVHEPPTDLLRVVAALGADTRVTAPIAVNDQCSVSARVYRTQHPLLVEEGQMVCAAEAPYRRGAMLSVPIMWTTPGGGEPLGVVNLSDRRSGHPFTAGDQKLIAAIATQIGTAIQNARLVHESLAQQRLVHEMELAHDLQMKLLPASSIVAPDATVAARVVPAESVGGDFYNLFKLGERRVGIMIGDVSGHGYQAALIMALMMSASAIHSQTTADPGETLHALFSTVRDELATTEMFISAFYGVIDRARGDLYYANTGHPHAFIMDASGGCERLAAIDPPLGMAEQPPITAQRPWRPGEHLLVLFTDGVSDARNPSGERLGEERVLAVIREHRRETAAAILQHVLDLVERHTLDAPRRDDLTVVLLRS